MHAALAPYRCGLSGKSVASGQALCFFRMWSLTWDAVLRSYIRSFAPQPAAHTSPGNTTLCRNGSGASPKRMGSMSIVTCTGSGTLYPVPCRHCGRVGIRYAAAALSDRRDREYRGRLNESGPSMLRMFDRSIYMLLSASQRIPSCAASRMLQ
jgi:hypothetical protein